MFPRLVNQTTNMQAASPGIESARLFSMMGVGLDAASVLAVVLMLMAAISVFASLYNSFKNRKYELAIMRSMGAAKSVLFKLMLLEGMLITAMGAISGVLLAHIAALAIAAFLSASPVLAQSCTFNMSDMNFGFVNLAGGSAVHITHPNGTDLTVDIKGRPVLVSDGVISEEDIEAGGASNSAYLPAGEVYTTPVKGTANGKLVNSRSFYRGKQIDNLTMEFKDGKMTGITGSGPGFADLKAEYDAVDDARKDDFAFIDLGINPNIKLPAESTVGNWVPAGTISVGTGANVWAGGDNTVPYGQVVSLPGSTVTLDGKAIIENGSLKL